MAIAYTTAAKKRKEFPPKYEKAESARPKMVKITQVTPMAVEVKEAPQDVEQQIRQALDCAKFGNPSDKEVVLKLFEGFESDLRQATDVTSRMKANAFAKRNKTAPA